MQRSKSRAWREEGAAEEEPVQGRTAGGVETKREGAVRKVRAGSSAPNFNEAANGKTLRPSGTRSPSGVVLAKMSCVTLARSPFSLSHSCLVCQVGMRGPVH